MDALAVTANESCPIARALEVLGQKWTLLILREAMRGRTTFSEFRAIGVPSEVLATRLKTLVTAGILRKQAYRAEGDRARDEYVLTEAGHDTAVVLGALAAWGVQHGGVEAPPLRWADVETGRTATVGFTSAGNPLDSNQVRLVGRNPSGDAR